MTVKKSSESRRKLLKSIAAGSGAIVAGKSLPESWSKPVVDSMMLPAHAQTSGQIYGGRNLLVTASMDADDNSLLAGWIKKGFDSLLPLANAGFEDPVGFVLNGCAVVMGENVEVWLQFLAEGYLLAELQNTIPLVGEGTLNRIIYGDDCTTSPGAPVTAAVSELPDDFNIRISLTVDGAPGVVTFPRTNICPSKEPCTRPELPG